MNALQTEVFAFLGAPASHGVNEVRRFDTHAAAVFLAGDRAFKVKRAVHFPFLDYSTLEKREAACRAELDVNRRFAPALYLQVVPITRGASGHMAIGGDGEVVEWVVEMRRFDENQGTGIRQVVLILPRKTTHQKGKSSHNVSSHHE